MSIISNMPSVAEYAATDRAGKANMRSTWETAMRDAIRSGDIVTASAIMARIDEWKSNVSSVPVVVDWSAIASVRVATLRRAADMIESGAVRPNGIPDETELTFDSSATADDDIAHRIASEPIRRSTKSDLSGAVASIVGLMDIGTFYRVSDVAALVASNVDAYRDRRVSPGAVRNVLESNKIPNVRFVPSTSDHPNGCVRES